MYVSLFLRIILFYCMNLERFWERCGVWEEYWVVVIIIVLNLGLIFVLVLVRI